MITEQREKLRLKETYYIVPGDINELDWIKSDVDDTVEQFIEMLKRYEKGENIPNEILSGYYGRVVERFDSRYGEIVYRIKHNGEVVAFVEFEKETENIETEDIETEDID